MKLVTKLAHLYLTLEDLTSLSIKEVSCVKLQESWKNVAQKTNKSCSYIRTTNTKWLHLSESELASRITTWLNGGQLELPSPAFVGKTHQKCLPYFLSLIEDLRPQVKNPSKEWVEKQLVENALDRKLAAALKKHYKREDFDDLRSHAYTWLLHWGEIGQFDEWLKTHDSIKPSVLVEWLKQKMRTEVFARGKDALTRQNTGARTQYEIARGEVHKQSLQISADMPDVVFQQGDKEGEFERHIVCHPVEIEEENEQLSFTRDLIRLTRKKAGDRYVQIFDWMCQENSLEEIAELEGVSKNRAAKLTQRIRDDLKQGAITTAVAHKILKEITEEPFSTIGDLEEVISAEEKASLNAAIEILSYRKMIQKNHQGCFLATKDGQRTLTEGTLF